MTTVSHNHKGSPSRGRTDEQLGPRRAKSARFGTLNPLTLGIGALVLALGVAGALFSGAFGGPRRPAAASATVSTMLNPAPGTNAALSTSLPPWPLPSDPALDISAAGLAVAPQEATAVHYHAHLDIIVNGASVTVPAGIGFIIQNGQVKGITSVHTHDPSGVIHVEAPTASPFSLGQFFTEWGVYLGNGRLGGLTSGSGEVLRTYVNGRLFDGNPASIALRPHQEIVLWYGSPSVSVHLPAAYQFAAGE